MSAKKGLTIPVNGMHGSWIIKLPSQKFEGVPENEFSMMTLARKLGMDIPDVQLVSLKKINGLPSDLGTLNGPAFAVHRFDRTPNGPVHTEDFAQVFGVYPHDKYGRASYRNLATVVWRETGTTGMTEFIRRLVFNTLIGNADMHLKNWSLIYPDRHTAQLAPAYDFVSTIPYIPDSDLALKMATSKRMADLSLNELSHLIDKAGLPKQLVLDTARETVKRFKDVWKLESKNLPLTSHVVKTIEKHVKTIRLFREIK